MRGLFGPEGHGGLHEEVIVELKMKRRYSGRQRCKRIPSGQNSMCKGPEVDGSPAASRQLLKIIIE